MKTKENIPESSYFIDCTNHPAFSEFTFDNSESDGALNALFSKIEGKKASPKWAIREFEKILNSNSKTLKSLTPHILDAFVRAIERFQSEVQLKRKKPKNPNSASPKARSRTMEMEKNGFVSIQMPKKFLEPLLHSLEPDMNALRKRRDLNDGSMLTCNPGPEPHRIVDEFCKEDGVYETLATLYGIPFGTVGFCLHLSHPKDRWYKVFKDHELPETVQMHYDLDYAIPKSMLYLNDIGNAQGPFSLIPESRNWPGNGFSLCLRKEVGYAMQHWIKKQRDMTSELDCSPFTYPEVREAFASLPNTLRSTAHPGDHIQNGTPLSKQLLSLEKKIIGPAGTLGLFTGGNTLHRGGIVTEGERWALQLCFWPLKEESTNSFQILKATKNLASKALRLSKRIVKKVLRVFSKSTVVAVTEQNTYSYIRFSKIISQIVKDKKVTAIDIGGASDLQPHWHRLSAFSNFYIFEPHEESFNALQKRKAVDSYYSNFHYIPKALAGESGTRTLYLSNAPTGTSLYPPGKKALSNYEENKYLFPMSKISIPVVTLKETLTAINLNTAECIKLDTQGSELEILQSLGETLSADLLLVEMEISTVDAYDDSKAAHLETVIPYMKKLGLELFDLRTSRAPGNIERLGTEKAEAALMRSSEDPVMAQRLLEVDAIFFLDPRHAIDNGLPQEKLRKLIVLLSVYNFFHEAVFATLYGAQNGILSSEDKNEILKTLKAAADEASLQCHSYKSTLAQTKGMAWAQYMETKHPSF